MKKSILFAMGILLQLSIFAQVPQSFKYQAVIRNTDGTIIAESDVELGISILQGCATCGSIFSETHSVTTNKFGLVNIEIGSIETASFESIDWSLGLYFVEVSVNGTVMGTSQLLSVPYALHAKTADNVSNLSDPINDNDATTKKYVDDYIIALETKIKRVENTMLAGGVVSDYEGNTYNTVKIGNQIWMAENLRSTVYSDGTPIQKVEDNTAWLDLQDTDKAYCWYDNNLTNGENFGALYTFEAATNGNHQPHYETVDIQGVCPSGWHIPTHQEWDELEAYLKQNVEEFYEGDYLKLGNQWKVWVDWDGVTIFPVAGNNDFGFTAYPSGIRQSDGTFVGITEQCDWWSSQTGMDPSFVEGSAKLVYNFHGIDGGESNKKAGCSVRCIKD